MFAYGITNQFKDNMAVNSPPKNKKLYYDISIDDNKDYESEIYFDEAMVEKYLADKEKAMIEDKNVSESDETVAENIETETEEDLKAAMTESEECQSIESSDNESETEMSDNLKESFEYIINNVMESYKNEYGEYPSLNMLEKGLRIAKVGLFDNYIDETVTEYETEAEEEDINEFADELEDALAIAGDIGSIDQKYLVNSIMDSYYEINERECTLGELRRMVYNIEDELQEEAAEEILDSVDISDSDEEDEDESDDEDYVINDEDIMQGVLDDNIDLEDNFDEQFEDALLSAALIGNNDQKYLVNSILDMYYEIFDEECSLDQLEVIFGNMKDELEREAEEDLYDTDESESDVTVTDSDYDSAEEEEEDDSSSDEEYVITNKDIRQGILDDAEESDEDEIEDDSEEEDEEEEDFDEYESDVSDSDGDYSDDEYNEVYDEESYDGDYKVLVVDDDVSDSDVEENESEDEDYVVSDKDIMQGILDDSIDFEGEFGVEFEDALLAASIIGCKDQIYLVDNILDMYYEMYDKECSLNELRAIFSNIKDELKEEAVEAMSDIDDVSELDDSESDDEDYVITKRDIMQGLLDDSEETDDEEEDSEEDSEEEEFDEYESNVSDNDSDYDSDYDPLYDEENYDNDYELYQ